jgi:hypothetical protein
MEKIQALKAQKIVWRDENFSDDIFAITVDGMHCWIQEQVCLVEWTFHGG